MILAVSGKINSGKDTVGKIIQIIKDLPHFTDEAVLSFLDRDVPMPKFTIKKFADKTTECFYLITGINYHKLNKEEKEKTRPKYVEFAEKQKEIFEKNVWVNALMSKYKAIGKGIVDCMFDKEVYHKSQFPNWIITDMRFPNELKAVKDRDGLTIRVNRPVQVLDENSQNVGQLSSWQNKHAFQYIKTNFHESETALDDAKFDEVINNKGSLLELVVKVRKILIKNKII
tara:strand:- start:5926 stop:6612 length:687 start_codon:yes stop_codon:yes gene_type:complete